MPDVTIEITIPGDKVMALKRAIEYAYANDLIAKLDGVELDEQGKLTGQEVLAVFRAQTYNFWRKKVRQVRAHEAEALAQDDGIFDPNLLP